jgi:hypothetical protein
LFYFGFKPRKITALFPLCRTISIIDLNKHLATALNPNEFDEGRFHHCITLEEGDRSCGIYFFRFDKTTGCRGKKDTAKFREFHEKLPVCEAARAIEDKELLKLKGDSIAASYYYTNPSNAPTIKYGDDEVTLIFKNTAVSACGGSEAARGSNFKTKLEQHLQSCASSLKMFDISALKIKCNGLHVNICPFSGGGVTIWY